MSGDNVIILNCRTRLDLPPERVLSAALDEELKSAIVIGYMKDGSEYFASSPGNRHEVLWLLERFKKILLEGIDD